MRVRLLECTNNPENTMYPAYRVAVVAQLTLNQRCRECLCTPPDLSSGTAQNNAARFSTTTDRFTCASLQPTRNELHSILHQKGFVHTTNRTPRAYWLCTAGSTTSNHLNCSRLLSVTMCPSGSVRLKKKCMRRRRLLCVA